MNYDVILDANNPETLETRYAFTQGDYGKIQLSIRIKADGAYVTNASRAYIVFSLSNGMIVTGADMPKNAATYTYVFKGNELQSPGKVIADVKLVYKDGRISSNKFSFRCRYDPLADKNVKAGPYITELQQIIDQSKQKLDYLQSLIDLMQNGLGETVLTKNMMTNVDTNDVNKIPTAALVHAIKQTTDGLDVGTYKVAVVFQSNAANGNYRAFHNFCIDKTYNITINTATISGSGTDIKGLIRVSAGMKYALFYGTDVSLAGKAAEINITVK